MLIFITTSHRTTELLPAPKASLRLLHCRH